MPRRLILAGRGGGSVVRVTVRPGRKALHVTGLPLVVTESVNRIATPAVRSLTLTGLAPTVTSGGYQTATPAVRSLTLAGIAPTVAVTGNKTATPTVGNLAVTGIAPTVSSSGYQSVSPTRPALVVAGIAPTIATSANKIATPARATLVLTRIAPTVTSTGSFTITPTVGSLLITRRTPTVARGTIIRPTVRALVITRSAPNLGSCGIVGTLQSAIDATSSGGTLNITGCTFHETVTINHPMTLIGGTIDADLVRNRWVNVTGADVTINGTTMIDAAAGSFQSAGLDVGGVRFTGRNLRLNGGSYACARVWVTATDAQFIDCEMTNGPSVGLLGYQAHNTIVDGGRYYHNIGSTNPGNESGGMKFGVSTGVTVQNVEADHNVGPGVWLDISCDGGIMSANHAHDNSMAGLMFEIGDGCSITGNTVNRNGTAGSNAFESISGIMVSSSRNVTVTGNTAAFNNAGAAEIAFVSQNRAPYPHNGNSASGNVVRVSTGIAAYTDWADTGGSNTISGNTFVVDSDPRISGLA